MKVAHLSQWTEEQVSFRDGLGVRVRAESETGESVERLQLVPAFAPVDHAIRDRVSRLANLQHVKFARLRTFEKGRKGEGPTVVSSLVEGTRVSDILMLAGHGLLDVDTGPALQITREVLAALTILHDSRNVTHGALGPERVVLTPHGRVVIVEHVLAQALDKLQLPRHQLWRDWRIATPPAAGPARFDVRTDLAQVGLLVLALLIGRPMEEEEYPHRIRALLPTVQARLADSAATPMARDLLSWLERLLPVDARRAFTTVRDAQHGFEAIVAQAGRGVDMSPAKVKALLAAHAALSVEDVRGEDVTDEPRDEPSEAPSVPSECVEQVVSLHDPCAAPVPATAEVEALTSLPTSDVEARHAAVLSIPEPVTAFAADDTVDIEALLRLAAELEQSAPPMDTPIDTLADSATAPSPLDASPATSVIEVTERSSPPVVPAFELVADIRQEEPTFDDVRALEAEVVLGGRLSLLPESRPAAGPLRIAQPSSLDDLNAEREHLRQRFADILQSVAPPQAHVDDAVAHTVHTARADVPAGQPVSLVQDAARWSFEVVPAQAPGLADVTSAGLETATGAGEALPEADVSESDSVISASPPPPAAAPVGQASSDEPGAPPSWWHRALGWSRGAHVVTEPVSADIVEQGETIEASALAGSDSIPIGYQTEDTLEPVPARGEVALPADAVGPVDDPASDVRPAAEHPAKGITGDEVTTLDIAIDDSHDVIGSTELDAAAPVDVGTALVVTGDSLPSGLLPPSPDPDPVARDEAAERLPMAEDDTCDIPPAASELLEFAAVGATFDVDVAPDQAEPEPVAETSAPADESSNRTAARRLENGLAPLDSGCDVELTPTGDAVESALSEVTGPDAGTSSPIDDQPAEAAVCAWPLPVDGQTPAAGDAEPTSILGSADDVAPAEPVASGVPFDVAMSLDGVATGESCRPDASSGTVHAEPATFVASSDDGAPAEPVASRVSSDVAMSADDVATGEGSTPDTGSATVDAAHAPLLASADNVASTQSDASGVPFDVAMSGEVAESITSLAPAADVSSDDVVPGGAGDVPMPAAPPAPLELAAAQPRSKRRRSRKRKATPTPLVATVPPAPAPPVETRAPAAAAVPQQMVGAVESTTTDADGLVASTSLGRSSRPVSLVERDVPSWVPPENLEAIAAEARRRKLKPVTPVEESAPAIQPADVTADAAPPPAAPGPLMGPRPAAVVPPCAEPIVTPVTDALVPVSVVREQPSPRTVVVFRSQINWRRTIAASIVLALLEGAAFAAAWWWVHPGARGTLVVQTSQPGIEVLLDGSPVGETPFREELAPGRHQLTLRQGSHVREMPVEISAGVVTTQTLPWPDGDAARVGALTVTSAPSDAEVVIGGRVRGRTPLTLDGLAAGRQAVTLRSASGTVSATAVVRAGETTTIDVPIFAGWVVVHASVDLVVTVGGTRVGSNLDGQILLAPGTHRIDVSNERLGFAETLMTTVEPGRTRHLTVTLPEILVDGQGLDGVEVWMDGERRGTLPAEVRVPLGTHEVVLRYPDGTERRRTVTVRADAPLRLN